MDIRRSVNTKIWDDVWFESLCVEDKLLWIYLLTNKNTNMLGVYEVSEKKISFETGLSLESVRKAFKGFEIIKKAKYLDGYVVLFNWIKNQSYNTNMKKSALEIYQKLPNRIKISIKNVFEYQLIESFGSLSKDYLTLPKKEDEKEKEKEDEKEVLHNNIFRDLWISKKWIEEIAIKYKRNINEVHSHLDRFRRDCILKGDYKGSEKDTKSHFINWINVGNPIPTKKIDRNPV